MSEVDVAAKRAARLKRAKAEAAGSDAVDATSSQDGGRVMSSFRMEPLEMGSEGRPRGVYDSGPPPRGVSRLEMLFFYTYVSIAVGGTVLLLGYYWYKVRACPPQVSSLCAPASTVGGARRHSCYVAFVAHARLPPRAPCAL